MKNTIVIISLLLLNTITVLRISAENKEKNMDKVKTASEIAKKAKRPAGAPEYAEVCFRYMSIRIGKFPTVEDAKKAMGAFHATRVDWFYPGTHTAEDGAKYVNKDAKAFIDWCHENKMKIGGAINNNTKNPKWKYKKHHLDRYVGEVKNPEFVADVLSWGKAQIDAGVDTMVCDDIFKYDVPRQKLWSDNFLAKLKAYKPGFTIAGNCGHNISTDYVKNYAVDFHYSDNNFVPDPGDWWTASKAHRKEKSALLLHPNVHMSKEKRRILIALGYANGAHVITPWDEYIHGKKRLFAKPADFADLYGFARALGQKGYLNGYEDAVVGGYDLKETRYGDVQPIIVDGGSGKVSVFGRAKPGDADAPVVLHLVESGKPDLFKIKLHRESFFKSGNIALSLLVPTVYEEKIHNKAEESKDYSQLSKEIPIKTITEGDWIVAEIPPLTPWGMLSLSLVNSKSGADMTFSDMAVARVQVAGAPRASDVCMSSRWKHPRNAESKLDTFETGDAFHATRLDWVYSVDQKWIGECRKRGYSFGATVNSTVKVKGDTANEQGRLRNKKGERVTAPWMRKWKAWWGCVNAPSFRKAFLEQATQALDAGAEVIHVDDPGINAAAGRWGACFCEHCKAKAKAEGVDLNRKMGAFQRASVEEFYKDFREKIDAHAGRHVAVSSNNYGGAWGWPYSLFDYGIGEFKSHLPGPIYKAVLDARKHKKNQVFTLGSYVRVANQYAIATTYAMGAHLLVPWDVWIPNSPRVYGKPHEYAHFYGFVRAIPEYLDGYGEAFVTGYDLPKPSADLAKIDGGKTIALVRAKPGDANAPVVVHVVNYNYRRTGCSLTISKAALGFGDKVKVSLLTPTPYNKALHEQVIKAAEALRGNALRGPDQAKAFEPLRTVQVLEAETSGDNIVIKLPEFGIWGVVVIEADTAEAR